MSEHSEMSLDAPPAATGRGRSAGWYFVFAAAVFIAISLAACGSDEPVSETAATAAPVREIELQGGIEISGIESWINSAPLTIRGELEAGRAVLIDFWTYTCVNCIRTLPFLRDWHAKYAGQGLTIIGVHAPEFDFEKDRDNVVGAIAAHRIAWPVAQDNDMTTWRAFGNRYWPAKYLFGPDGTIRYSHFGEGGYVEAELEIRAVLEEFGSDLSGIAIGSVDELERDPRAFALTRELYGGYQRNYNPAGIYAGQDEYYDGGDETVFYTDTGDYNDGQFYLQGLWRNEREAIVHARETETPEDYLAIEFSARSVNVVIDPGGTESFDVILEIDDRPLTAEEAGADVQFDGMGRSFLHVDEARMFGIVELPGFGVHVLKLRSTSDNLAIFAFAFGNYTSGV